MESSSGMAPVGKALRLHTTPHAVDPENIYYILSKNFSNFPKGPEFKEVFDALGDGIFNSDSDLWKNKRKFAQAMMNHHSFCKFLLKPGQDKVENGLIPMLNHVCKSPT
ncbi:alkane hydroxylase MAH1-like [Melia azedarach]|uniref:Alkane hydroxylase MAH1-like n=1 Tax=Melia azedarach TaxID=155640 RepID=A0ACC1XVS7_MELAZ|nr:alkane hydroxylase MAH1-like [Melia azedarach]